MGKELKLVNKLNRKAKKVKVRSKGFDQYDKMSQSEEKMAKSQGAYKLVRKIQRRLDRNFGIDALGYEPKVSKRVKVNSLARFDYGTDDYGIKATFAAGYIAAIGLQPGDIVRILSGNGKGLYLAVVEITDSTNARLEDSEAFNYAGEAEISLVTAVADVAGSLDGLYFEINSANDATEYYVWLDVDAGGNDPLVVGKTAIPVSIASDDSAEDIASAIATAVDANADFSASAVEDAVIIVNAAVGDTTDVAAGNSTFSVETSVQGVDADPTVSNSNVHCRFQLSDVKASAK